MAVMVTRVITHHFGVDYCCQPDCCTGCSEAGNPVGHGVVDLQKMQQSYTYDQLYEECMTFFFIVCHTHHNP